MGQSSIRIGSIVNAQVYDDVVYSSAIETLKPLAAGDPVLNNHVITLGFVAFKKLTVADIDSPTELNALVGKNGDVIVVQQIIAGALQDVWTLYTYDADGPAINSPYIVDASGAGAERWIALGGKYSAVSQTLLGSLTVDDLLVDDEVYGAPWNGSLEVPTKNALYDKIEAMIGGLVSDVSYAASWDGVTTVAPSKNSVYDKIEVVITSITNLVSDLVYGAGWDGVTDVAPSLNTVYDKIQTLATAQAPGAHTVPLAKITAGGVDGSLTFTAEGVISAYVDPT